MKIRRIHIERLRNISHPIDTGEIHADVVLVAGPNGSGKSSLVRAIRALLWPRHGGAAREQMMVSAEFSDARGAYTAARMGTDISWTRDGANDEGPSLVDAEAGASYLFGIDDIVRRDDATAQSIATALARELTGGFDVSAAKRQLTKLLRSPRTCAHAVTAASQSLREVAASQEQIAQHEQQLADLQRELTAAAGAATQLEQLVALRQLGGLRAELAMVREQLAEFPAGMSALQDDTATRIETLRSDIAATEQRLTAAQTTLADRDATIASTRLQRMPEPVELHELDALITSARDAAANELHAARDIFGPDYEPGSSEHHDDASILAGAHVSEPQLRRAHELYDDVVACDARAVAVQAQLALLESAQAAAVEAEESPTDLQRTLHLIDELLELPSQVAALTDAHQPRRAQRMLALTGLALLVIGVIAALTLVPQLLVLAGVGAGLIISALAFHALAPALEDDAESTTLRRKQLFSQIANDATGIDIAPGASRRALAAARAKLASTLAVRDAARVQHQHNGARLTELTHAARAHGDERTTLCAQWNQLLVEVDAPELPLEPHAVRMLAAACRLDTERDGRRIAAGVLRDARHATSQITTQLRALLEPLIGNAARAATQIEALAALVADVHQWAGQLTAATETRPKSAELAEHCHTELATLQTRWAELFARLEIPAGDDLELRARLARRTHFIQLSEQHADLQARVNAAEQLHATDPELASIGADEFDAKTAELTQRASQREALQQRIDDIRTDVRAATQSTGLTEAQQKYQAAYDILAGALDAALDAQAAEFMLGDVSQLEAAAQPEVVRSLADWFARFTHHRYTLRVATSQDGDASFVATDTSSNAQVQLDELSTATRTQLLIAARVAWTEQLESAGAARLPWILDESLAATDPERFTSIIRGLVEAASEVDRQVWYLTSDNAELGRVAELAQAAGRSVQIIDVAALTGEGHALHLRDLPQTAGAPATLAQRAADESYDAWGERCGAARLDFARGIEAVDIWHVAREDDQLVGKLQALRLKTAGQLRASGSGGRRLPGIDGQTLQQLLERCEMLDACIDGWRAGRGGPVRAADVMAAELNSTKASEVAGLAEQLFAASPDGCNGLDLLRALRGELAGVDKVSGLRTTMIDKLEQYLLDTGLIDERDQLDHDAIRLRALGHAGSLNLTDAGALVDAWLRHAGLRITTTSV